MSEHPLGSIYTSQIFNGNINSNLIHKNRKVEDRCVSSALMPEQFNCFYSKIMLALQQWPKIKLNK
jgi:hypothetical protein